MFDHEQEYIRMLDDAPSLQDWSTEFVDAEIRTINGKELWIPTFEELINVHTIHFADRKLFDGKDFFTILHFSNFVEEKVKEDHGYGLIYPTKEMIALHFVMEEVEGYFSGWGRNFFTYKLEGGWVLQ